MSQDDDSRYQDYIDDENRSLDAEYYRQQQRKLSDAVLDSVRKGNIDEAKRLLGVPPTQSSSASLNEMSHEQWRTKEGQSKLLRHDRLLVQNELESKLKFLNPSVAEHITNIIDFTTVNEDPDRLRVRAIVLENYSKDANKNGLEMLALYLKDMASRYRTIVMLCKSWD